LREVQARLRQLEYGTAAYDPDDELLSGAITEEPLYCEPPAALVNLDVVDKSNFLFNHMDHVEHWERKLREALARLRPLEYAILPFVQHIPAR
jgi:hypothetical protein